jgi:hypothetical protein
MMLIFVQKTAIYLEQMALKTEEDDHLASSGME